MPHPVTSAFVAESIMLCSDRALYPPPLYVPVWPWLGYSTADGTRGWLHLAYPSCGYPMSAMRLLETVTGRTKNIGRWEYRRLASRLDVFRQVSPYRDEPRASTKE